MIWWHPIIGIAVYSLNHWLLAIGLSSQVSAHAWLFVPIMLLVGTVGFLWLIPTPGGTLLRVVPIVICTRNEHVDQLAGGQKVRVSEQIARLSHRRPRHVAPFAASRNLVLRQSGQHLLQGRDQPGPLRQPRDIGREAWVRGQFLQPEFLDKSRPLLVAGDPDEQLAPGSGFERPVGYGLRSGILGAPARSTQAASPLLFNLLMDRMGICVLAISAGLSLSALVALVLLKARPAAAPAPA